MSCCEESSRTCCPGKSLLFWVFTLVIAGFVVACLPEIKRYIKISSM